MLLFSQSYRSFCNTKESLRFVDREESSNHYARQQTKNKKQYGKERECIQVSKQKNKQTNSIRMHIAMLAYCVCQFPIKKKWFKKMICKIKSLLCRFCGEYKITRALFLALARLFVRSFVCEFRSKLIVLIWFWLFNTIFWCLVCFWSRSAIVVLSLRLIFVLFACAEANLTK